MFFHVIYTITFSFFVSSLLISYDLLIKNFRLIEMQQNFKILMAILLFISQVYFIISFSLNSVGYIVYEYTISLFIFYFGVNKKKILLIFLTQFITLMYFMLLNFKDLSHFVLIVLMNFIVIGVFYVIKKWRIFNGSNDLIFFIFFTLTNIVSLYINSRFFFRREIIAIDIFAVLTGSAIIFFLWLYYLKSQRMFMSSVDKKIYERNYDELTKFKNYRSLNEDLANRRKEEHLTAVILDLDHFKRINDYYGHETGNKALVFFSEKLTEFLKSNFKKVTYQVYRYGGEEFLITFNTKELEVVKNVIIDFQNFLRKKSLAIDHKDQIVLYFSAGISTSNKDVEFITLISEADNALYHAKKSGRNKVFTYEVK